MQQITHDLGMLAMHNEVLMVAGQLVLRDTTNWGAVKELYIRHSNKETLLLTVLPMFWQLNSIS